MDDMRIEIGVDVFEVDCTGRTLAEIMQGIGMNLDLPCNGRGSCGKCKVRVTGRLSGPTDAELHHLNEEEMDSGVRLACQVVPLGDCVVKSHLPADRASDKILVEGVSPARHVRSVDSRPFVDKHVINVPQPDIRDQRYYLDRVLDSLVAEAGVAMEGRLHVPREVLSSLPSALRDCQGKVTVAHTGDRVISVEPGDTVNQHYGIAFDVGTTTVVGYLVDLRTGAQLSAASCTNPQVAHGSDLISRITFSSGSDEAKELLRSEILAALDDLIRQLVSDAEISADRVYHVAIAGNTCMTHMLLGLETASLATMPYVGLTGRSYHDQASGIGLGLRSEVLISVLPNVGGFVGSDTVAAAIAAELDSRDGTSFLLDLGTNGELVLSRCGELLACSTAAGPAFEGAHIVQGMRGTAGAIESVALFDGDVELGVIGKGTPLGICGSGLVQAVAELLRVGIVDSTGRLGERRELETRVDSRLAQRVSDGDKGRRFVLYCDAETEVSLYQSDIRELQLAKGAISAGFSVLCRRMGIACSDIDVVLLAGAFGNYVDKAAAVRIGMLPGVDEDRVVSLGNAAGTGAKMVLTSGRLLNRADELARQMRYMELGNDPGFQDEFMKAMVFPAAVAG